MQSFYFKILSRTAPDKLDQILYLKIAFLTFYGILFLLNRTLSLLLVAQEEPAIRLFHIVGQHSPLDSF